MRESHRSLLCFSGHGRAVRWDRCRYLSITQRFGYVPPLDIGRAFKIGQGSGDTQYPVRAPCGQTQPFGRTGQQRAARRIRAPRFVEQSPVRFGVGADAAFGGHRRVAFGLPDASGRDPARYRLAAFGSRRESEIPRRNSGNMDVKINAIQQRARQARLVFIGAARRPHAGEFGKVTATARVHRCNQLKPCRIGHMALRTGDRHPAGFERLPQRLERGAVELRQFIEKQHTLMREGNFAGRARGPPPMRAASEAE